MAIDNGMKGFRTFFEALKFNDPKAANLQHHPFVRNATFGVEIELLAVAAPFDEMRPEWLAKALEESDFEKEFIKAYQHNNPDYEFDDRDFINYIRMNKKAAWEALWNQIENYEYMGSKNDTVYRSTMISFWGKKVSQIITQAGFRIYPGKEANSNIWAFGEDGDDSEFNLPVLEIRSAVLTQNDIPKLANVFHGIANLVKANPKTLMARGNTGFHIHVSNPNGIKDGFTRLAAAQTTDEDAIWDVSDRHDRAFERHAAMNKPQDFETRENGGAHGRIMVMLDRILSQNSRSPQPTSDFAAMFNFRPGEHPNQKPESTITISGEELTQYVMGLDRNAGINVTSEHPTVEYRYLSSMLIIENPQKAIEFIQYFINHTASMSNKDRIKFENDDARYVLTKMPHDTVRIDKLNKSNHEQEWEDEMGRSLPSTYKYPRIPRSGLPRKDLDQLQRRSPLNRLPPPG
jgi:hypothetical protein